MSLKNYSHEELKRKPMVELSNLVLSEKKKSVPFKDLFDEIANLREFTDDERNTYIAQLYTDLNMDGRFVKAGSNTWGLKRWYPVDEVIEETKPAPKKKKKKKTAKKEPEIKEDDNEDVPDDGLEELTADFSKLDGSEDPEENEEDIDLFPNELDLDEDFDDGDLVEEDDEDDEEEDDEHSREY